MNEALHQLADVVLGIEAELRRLQLWAAAPPSGRALDSRMPFCCDTLEFGQWLQWVFIPRMKHIIEQGDRLPGESSILPFAENALLDVKVDTRNLLGLILRFDNLIALDADEIP